MLSKRGIIKKRVKFKDDVCTCGHTRILHLSSTTCIPCVYSETMELNGLAYRKERCCLKFVLDNFKWVEQHAKKKKSKTSK